MKKRRKKEEVNGEDFFPDNLAFCARHSNIVGGIGTYK
jgi:hypothetical protein